MGEQPLEERTPDSGQPKSELDAARELHNQRTATPVEESPYVAKLRTEREAADAEQASQQEQQAPVEEPVAKKTTAKKR